MRSRTAATAVAMWLSACSLVFSETKKPFADTLYKILENGMIREHLERLPDLARLERERKTKAGEPPISISKRIANFFEPKIES